MNGSQSSRCIFCGPSPCRCHELESLRLSARDGNKRIHSENSSKVLSCTIISVLHNLCCSQVQKFSSVCVDPLDNGSALKLINCPIIPKSVLRSTDVDGREVSECDPQIHTVTHTPAFISHLCQLCPCASSGPSYSETRLPQNHTHL